MFVLPQVKGEGNQQLCIPVPSQAARRFKALDLRKLENNRKM